MFTKTQSKINKNFDSYKKSIYFEKGNSENFHKVIRELDEITKNNLLY